ncbi:MAG: site-specific integrase, partial [Bacteroidia bacterium]
MAEKNTPKFYLDQRKDKDTGEPIIVNIAIRLFYSWNKKRLQYFTGLHVDLDQWDATANFPKRNKANTELINELNKLIIKLDGIVNKAQVLGNELSLEDLRAALKGKKVVAKETKSFFEYFDEYKEYSELTKAPGTMRAIRSSYNHFKDFEKKTKFKLEFSKIDQAFYDKFLDYCFNKLHIQNAYTGKLIKDLKAFLNWAADRGYNNHFDFRKKSFKKLTEEIEIVFLTYEELISLYNHDFSESANKDAIRDLFCFGCFTGMRLSDILALAPENVHTDKILFRVEKTEQTNTVPLNPYSKAILDKYKGRFEDKALPSFSEGFINLELKSIFSDVELERNIHMTHFRGAKKMKEVLPLKEIITFHVSKKTFMTNFLAKGGSLITAMSITGNKDFKTAKR